MDEFDSTSSRETKVIPSKVREYLWMYGASCKGFNLEKYSGIDKRKILRNCVFPPFGKHVLDCARGNTQYSLTQFIEVNNRD